VKNVRALHSWILAAVCAAGVGLAPGSALAENQALTVAKTGGLGAGSALVSLVYGPIKLVYASTGLLVSGLAYAFSGGDKEVAKVVLLPSVLGDYVITPEMLTGDRTIQFFGREPGYEAPPQEAPVASAPEQANSPGAGSQSSGDWSSGW
jgi:hypothetical protein